MSSLASHQTFSSFKTTQSGFTLLELVLVMFIIALVASTPLLFIDEQDQQLRYEETKQKLDQIRKALYREMSYTGSPVLSGFIVNNGHLPSTDADLNQLIEIPSNWQTFGSIQPEFKINSALDAEAIDNPGFRLIKGHLGNYIPQLIDSAGEVKDAWGEDFSITSSGGIFSVESSNALQSISTEISNVEWGIPLTNLRIILQNDSSTAITSSDGKEVALLVFDNKDTSSDSSWISYHFKAEIDASAAGVPGIQYSWASDANWFRNGDSLSVSEAQVTTVPAGEHLLIIDPQVSSTPSSTPHAFVRILPGALVPPTVLTVSP